MQIEWIKVFCDVARCRNFSQAAVANDLTQSAVSQAVLSLEKRLGGSLIDRSTRPLQLTPLGKRFYDGCNAMIEQYLDLEQSIRSASSQMAHHVDVVAIFSISMSDMSQLTEQFKAQNPGSDVRVRYLHPDQVYREVEQGTADFGLVSFPRKSKHLLVTDWRQEPMVLACTPRHRLGQAEGLRPKQLVGEKYVGFAKSLVIRREVDRFFREHEVTVDVIMEFDSIENIKKAVLLGEAVALLPEPTLQAEVQAGMLRAVPLVSWKLNRPLGIIQRRRHKLSATAERFLASLRQQDAGKLTVGASNGSSSAPNGNPGSSSHRRRASANSTGSNGASH